MSTPEQEKRTSIEGGALPPAQSSSVDRGILLRARRELEQLLSLEECIAAVEEAFRAHAEGRAIPPGVLGAHVEGGRFHIKAAGLLGSRPYYAAKLNGNFYHNEERFGLPRIQGLIVLCDACNGSPLAVMDSGYITLIRTAAATAVAAKYLARRDAETITICGCGLQGRVQLAAIRRVRPIKKAYLHDLVPSVAHTLASELAPEIAVQVLGPDELSQGTRRSEITVTCTPSRDPLLGLGDIAAGALVAAVGADSEEKQELEVDLLGESRIVVDHLEQCATIGELHHALAAGAVSRAGVHGELQDIVCGRKPGRVSAEERFVFDSTGVALQDVAAAAIAYERAVAAKGGTVVELL